MKVYVLSYLISRTVTVHRDQYEQLRNQKGTHFNFSRWVRACIANELGEELPVEQEKEADKLLEKLPRVKLPDGKELIVVDNIEEEQGVELSEDEEFVAQVERYIREGITLPEKTMERYKAAQERLKSA